MSLELILNIATAFGTVGAVLIAIYAIIRNDKNSKDQILTSKLEELFELIKNSARYYTTLKTLHNDVKNLRNPDYSELPNIEQYNIIRDAKFPFNERENLRNMLSRMEVLARCYTTGKTQNKILEYENLIYVLLEIANYSGSITETFKWEEGFPNYDKFYEMLIQLEDLVVSKITSKK